MAERDNLGPGASDLGIELVAAPTIVDRHIRQLAFLGHGSLRGEQALCSIHRHSSNDGALELLLGIAPDDGEQIVAPPRSGLDEERRFDHRHRTRSKSL